MWSLWSDCGNNSGPLHRHSYPALFYNIFLLIFSRDFNSIVNERGNKPEDHIKEEDDDDDDDGSAADRNATEELTGRVTGYEFEPLINDL